MTIWEGNLNITIVAWARPGPVRLFDKRQRSQSTGTIADGFAQLSSGPSTLPKYLSYHKEPQNSNFVGGPIDI